MKGMDYGFVCILDALGTKGSWKQEDPKNQVELIEGFVKNLKTNITAPLDDDEKRRLKIMNFSDSIFITFVCSKSNFLEEKMRLIWFCDLLNSPFQEALIDGLFLRGSISQGSFYRKSNMLIGPCVDDAASYYEKANWFGIICTPSTTYALSYALALEKTKNVQKEFRIVANVKDDPYKDHFVIEYDVPMKGSQSEYLFVIDWPKLFSASRFNIAMGVEPRDNLKLLFSKYPIPESAIEKYNNTLAFFDSRCANNQDK